jgi:hypothetical protein
MNSFLYNDIIIEDLLVIIKNAMELKLGKLAEGDFRILYSSNGEIMLKVLPISLRKKNKEIYIE